MWKNFKIRTKMMLGFALVLAVFAVSVAITWSLMSVLSDGNDFIVNTAIPAQGLARELNDSTYELLLAMRTLQYIETDEVITDVRSWMANVQKAMDNMKAFHAKTPEAVSAAYAVEHPIPKLERYFVTINQSLDEIARKKAALSVMVSHGNTMTDDSGALRTKLVELAQRDFSEMRNETASSDTVSQRLSALTQSGKISAMVEAARREFLRAVSTNDPDTIAESFTLLDGLDAELDIMKKVLVVPENQRLADNMKASVAGYRKAQDDYLVEVRALAEVSKVRNALRDEINNDTTESINLAEKRIRELSTASFMGLNRSIALLIGSAIISIVLGILIAFLISRSIANPLSSIVRLAKRAGDGDLTIVPDDFRYHGKDELGNLVDAISTMILAQESALGQVVAVSEKLGSSAGSLSAISEETSASMEEVKVSVDQVSTLSESNGAALQECNAGVEEMSAGADTVAQSATDSAAFISQTTEASNRAIQTVNKVINGMRDVDSNSKESEEKIKQLVASVENVSSFVSVITGIADQTNLLALNAAIEAARAGEVGRGFAVVAEEVRKLAEESARAAQNVNGIIVELQNGAQASIRATTDAGRLLGDTLTQAEQAQEELDGALREINKANDSIQNIAAVAEEQAASCKEVASAIDSATKSTMDVVEAISNIRKATEETAQAAKGVAVESDAVNEHAENLTEVLNRFKLNIAATSAGRQNPKTKALPARKK